MGEWDCYDSALWQHGDTIKVSPNQTDIKGQAEAMMLMREGDVWEVVLPAELAYGNTGVVGGLHTALDGDKVKPGDAVIMRLNITKILGKKKRLPKCDLKKKTYCDDADIQTLDKWSTSPKT